jgi:glucose-1-phosphate thymidylyltransferase
MKALVLCAGRGTRLRPLTHTRAKAALPVAGRPVLGHILHYLHRFGFDDVGVVMGPEQGELKQLHAGPEGQRVTFLIQADPKGIAHAVSTAERFLNGEPFLLYLGDNLTDEDLSVVLNRFKRERPDGLLMVRRVLNPRAFGVAQVEGGRVTRVVEKPTTPIGDLAIAGIYLFGPVIHQAITQIKPSQRGELEITDAVAQLLLQGASVAAHEMQGWWQDMGSPEGLLIANGVLLDRIATQIAPAIDLRSVQIQGRVVIESGVQLTQVKLRGPLWIGPNSDLKEAYIGPYTSVGEGVSISRSSLENSILLPGCRLQAAPFHLEDCLLGHGAVVELNTGRSITLLMGDDGRLQIPSEGR